MNTIPGTTNEQDSINHEWTRINTNEGIWPNGCEVNAIPGTTNEQDSYNHEWTRINTNEGI